MTSLPFIVRWRKALLASPVRATAKFVGVLLSLYANGDGSSIRPSVERVAADGSLSRRSVQLAIGELVDEHWLRPDRDRHTAGGRPIEYSATIPETAHVVHRPTAQHVHGSSKATAQETTSNRAPDDTNRAPRAPKVVDLTDVGAPVGAALAASRSLAPPTPTEITVFLEPAGRGWQPTDGYLDPTAEAAALTLLRHGGFKPPRDQGCDGPCAADLIELERAGVDAYRICVEWEHHRSDEYWICANCFHNGAERGRLQQGGVSQA